MLTTFQAILNLLTAPVRLSTSIRLPVWIEHHTLTGGETIVLGDFEMIYNVLGGTLS